MLKAVQTSFARPPEPRASSLLRAMLRRFQFFDKEEIKHDDSGIRVRRDGIRVKAVNGSMSRPKFCRAPLCVSSDLWRRQTITAYTILISS
jgi:hypothetical protein